MITSILDKIRISLGDSKCPLYHKCPGADEEIDTCVSYRGRNEEGKRAECYEFFKPIIKTNERNSGIEKDILETGD
jgi:hypothetical protein